MKFLVRLAAGDIALWCAFWLIGIPLTLVWDVSGACLVTGCGIQDPLVSGFTIALFALASAAIPLVSVAIWRSSSNYPRTAWWHGPLAIGAKLSAAFMGFVAALSLLAVLYFLFFFVYAAFADV